MKFINIFEGKECLIINLNDSSKNVRLTVGDEIIINEIDSCGKLKRAIVGYDNDKNKFFMSIHGEENRYNVQGTEVI